jgi:hypothetical protein
MALSFRFNPEGHLDWRDPDRLTQDLKVDKEEAMIVAVAEIAAALRHIAHELHRVHETAQGSAELVADAIKGERS